MSTLLLEILKCLFQEKPDPLIDHIEAKKTIVHLDNLLKLFTKCLVSDCCAAIDPSNVQVTNIGADIVITYTSNNHHSGKWHSGPSVGEGHSKVRSLNLQLATASLVCGLHVTQVVFFVFLDDI